MDSSHYSTPNSVMLVFTLMLHRTAFLGLLGIIRVVMTKENKSAFEINEVFMTTAIAALFAVEVVSVVLFCTSIYARPSTRNEYYTGLKFIGGFSAYAATFSLIMVLVLSPEHNWVGYLLVCLMFAVIALCFCCGNHQEDKKRQFTPPFNYLGLVLVPLSLLLVLFLPIYLNMIIIVGKKICGRLLSVSLVFR
ncbi:hypothetical protein QVD17_38412 [Tagetes erecta]|uniref:Uncharacterized protein n=1 Tax=Tagetes erecta TaxID=13708 RepID=A0AAD8NE95_TARER|nr:hypothetical protein QVD17_38412 [Tagetes erecta]